MLDVSINERFCSKLLIGISLLFMSTTSVATVTLDLERVFREVKKNFPRVLAARQEVKLAKAQMAVAQSQFDPTIRSKVNYIPHGSYENYNFDIDLDYPIKNSGGEVFTGYRIGVGDYPEYYGYNKTQSNGELNAGIRWPLLRNAAIDKRRADLLNAKTGIKLNIDVFSSFQLTIFHEAANAYWSWVEAGGRLKVRRNLFSIAKTRQAILQKRYEHGDIAYVDVIENKNLILQRQQSMLNAELVFAQAGKRLALYYSHANIYQLKTIPRDLDKLISDRRKNLLVFTGRNAISSSHNPQHAAFKKRLRQTNTNISLASNQLMPRLDSEVSIKQDLGHGSVEDDKSFNLTLSFSYPIFQRKAKAELSKQKIIYRRISQEAKFIKQQLATRFDNLKLQLTNKEQQIDLAREAVKISHELENTEIEKYNHGGSNLFLVNQRELFSYQAELTKLNVMIEYMKTRVELRLIDGSLIST